MFSLHTAKTVVNLDGEKILSNNVEFNHEWHSSHKLWLIGNEYGAVVAVWATNDQYALDEMVNLDHGSSFLVEPEDLKGYDYESNPEGYAFLGNAGEACNLDYAWIEEVQLDPARDFKLMLALAEARGAGVDNLSEI